MEDTVNSALLVELAEMIELHRGIDTTVLDIRSQSSWTDYFVIATASSDVHMRGLYRRILAFLDERNVRPRSRRKRVSENAWLLVDCGGFVVHIMSEHAREFYELERLWFEGTVLFHSSKSS